MLLSKKTALLLDTEYTGSNFTRIVEYLTHDRKTGAALSGAPRKFREE